MTASDTGKAATEPLFPKLSGGPSRLPPEKVAKHQRARLEGAMVEAVARHGYAGTTLRELVALAGVSKSTFYEHFESKQDCFFATFDAIVAIAGERIGEAYREPGEIRDRIIAGLSACFDIVIEEPAAATLVTVESLTLGAAGVDARQRGWATFERLIQGTFDSSPSRVKVSPLTVRAIVAGLRGTIYRHLREGRSDELPGQVETLTDWILSYQRRDSAVVGQARRAAERPTPTRGTEVSDGALSWDEPPDSRRSRAALTQRERIVRGAARVVYEKGYDALSVPAISGAAGVSNQTFYDNFSSKRDAFIEACEVLGQRAFQASLSAMGNLIGPEAIGVGLRALLEYTSETPMFARLAFFEQASAGPMALDRVDARGDAFTALLEANLGSNDTVTTPPSIVLNAIATGVWAVIQHELVEGRAESLGQQAPDFVRIVVAPLA